MLHNLLHSCTWGVCLQPRNEAPLGAIQRATAEEIDFPCDVEGEEEEEGQPAVGVSHLLNVANLSHIYPDGTHAVKNISFKVKEGEVLSFLGANGAGTRCTAELSLPCLTSLRFVSILHL